MLNLAGHPDFYSPWTRSVHFNKMSWFITFQPSLHTYYWELPWKSRPEWKLVGRSFVLGNLVSGTRGSKEHLSCPHVCVPPAVLSWLSPIKRERNTVSRTCAGVCVISSSLEHTQPRTVGSNNREYLAAGWRLGNKAMHSLDCRFVFSFLSCLSRREMSGCKRYVRP